MIIAELLSTTNSAKSDTCALLFFLPQYLVEFSYCFPEYGRRRRLFAAPLARSHNVVSVIMTAPFYGPRRRAGQLGSCLDYVSDLFAQGYGAVVEAVAIAGFFRYPMFLPLCELLLHCGVCFL
jgi:hypothetical protein